MNFNQYTYWPGLLVVFIVLVSLIFLMEKRFFTLIKKYWFYKRSIFSYLSTFLFVLGLAALLLSLLDLRGPEEKIKMDVPTDRTIILIDTSASMLAEDVKPSRLQKAGLIAKHFARKAAGHQLSVVAFAEIQKKIVPFTNDLDLIDARLDSLKHLRNHYGSSALTLAIQESIQYFRETEGEARGNILVLTDGEETAEGIKLKVPKEVNIAFVGIGTEHGGRIPLDDDRGFRFGYKKERGQDVITKLNESFFRDAASSVPSGKHWLTNSYSLPSEEILEFFKGEKLKGSSQQEMVIRPVLMEWLVVPGVLLLLCSYLFKAIRIFTLGVFLFILPSSAQTQNPPELSPEIVGKIGQLQSGKLDPLERIKLADDLQKAGATDEAIALYQENLPALIDKNIPPEAYLNYGTSLLSKGNLQGGISVYKNLSDSLNDSSQAKKIQEIMDKNIVSYFKQQEQKKKEDEKKKQESKDKKENPDQKEGQSGEGQEKDQKQSKSGEKKEDQKSKSKDQNQKKNESEDKDEKSQDSKNEADKEGDKKGDKPESDQIEKPLPPKKLPAKLKQLMADDRQLQMKIIENGTRDLNKRKSRKSKDW